MGVWSGNLSYNRYYVEGDVDGEFPRDWLLERVNHMSIPTLTVEAEDEQVIGWCNVENILSTEFSSENFFYNQYILFAMRIDSWKLPPALFKARLQEAEREYREETGKERLTKREKDQLKLKIRMEMKRQSLPSIVAYDVCWDWHNKVLRLWSLSSRINTMFLEHFEKSFSGVQLAHQSPYTMAERLQLEETQLEVMRTLEPETFVSLDGITGA